MKSPGKKEQRIRRHKRIRARILGTQKRPRFVVFRSNRHIYSQLVNDEAGSTLASASDIELNGKATPGAVGKLLASKAAKLQIVKVVFDRGGYKYHGNIKALAEGAREGGLRF